MVKSLHASRAWSLLAAGMWLAATMSLTTAPAWADDEDDAGAASDEEPVLATLVEESKLSISGGIYIWHYEPDLEGVDSLTEVYAAWVVLDRSYGDFGVHFEPRFRDTKLRSFFPGNIWVQEAYGYWKQPAGTLKFGKVYSRFGRFWDASFYGNLSYFDGFKLDPDVGLSFEGGRKVGDQVDLAYDLQFFTIDGSTNGSLTGRDTLSIEGARQRNSFIGRIAPTFKWGEGKSFTIGGSVQSFEADLPEPVGSQDVDRFNLETELALGSTLLYIDYTMQDGMSVPDHPFPGAGAEEIDYVQYGIQHTWKKLSFRYNLSTADYKDVGTQEILHQPGVTISLDERLAFLIEYVDWERQRDGFPDVKVDKSLNLILYASF